MKLDFILNGEDVSCQAEAGDRLADILRERFSLLGVKEDCRSGHCGLCMVSLNGRAVPSCLVPAFRVRGAEVVTIEGFELTDDYADLREGFRKAGAEPCEFCRGAVFLSAAALLDERPRPEAPEILEHLSAVFCRCHDPAALVRGVKTAADLRARRMYFRANR